MTIPAITFADLPAYPQPLLNVRRNVFYRAPSERLTYWHKNFETSAETSESFITYSGSGSPALNLNSGGKLSFTSGSGGGVANMMANVYLPCSQLIAAVKVIRVDSGGTYNQIQLGFALPATPTGSAVSDKFVAMLDVSTSQVQLFYTRNGGTAVYGSVLGLGTALEAQSYLYCMLNHNTLALGVSENGKERLLAQLKIDTAHHDMQLASKAAGLRPYLGFQSDYASAFIQVTDWSVGSWGTFGDREHEIVTNEDGSPYLSPDRLYYVAADSNGPSELISSDLAAVDRSQGAMWLYDADARRAVAMTAKYTAEVTINSTTYRFGAQEIKWMYDRPSQTWWGCFSSWNLHLYGETIGLYVVNVKECPLYGHVVIKNAVKIDFAGLLGLGEPWLTGQVYGIDWIKVDGVWYLGGTLVYDTYHSFVCRCTSPDTPVDLMWLDTVNAEEGTYFWCYGPNPYAVSCRLPGNIRVRELKAGTILRDLQLVGGGTLSILPALLPVVRGGQTSYQYLAFTTDDFTSAGNTPLYSFGPWVVGNLGTFNGEQFEREIMVSTAAEFTVDNTEIVPARVARLGRRNDGVTVAFPQLTIRNGETLPYWIDTTDIAGGRWLRSALNSATSDPTIVAIPVDGDGLQLTGVNRQYAVVWLTGAGSAGESANITIDITPTSGETIKAKLVMKIAAD
jgi:hypothetical protein